MGLVFFRLGVGDEELVVFLKVCSILSFFWGILGFFILGGFSVIFVNKFWIIRF